MGKKACPRLTVEVVGRDPYLEFTAKTPAGLTVGSVEIDGDGTRALMITNIYVNTVAAPRPDYLTKS